MYGLKWQLYTARQNGRMDCGCDTPLYHVYIYIYIWSEYNLWLSYLDWNFLYLTTISHDRAYTTRWSSPAKQASPSAARPRDQTPKKKKRAERSLSKKQQLHFLNFSKFQHYWNNLICKWSESLETRAFSVAPAPQGGGCPECSSGASQSPTSQCLLQR